MPTDETIDTAPNSPSPLAEDTRAAGAADENGTPDETGFADEGGAVDEAERTADTGNAMDPEAEDGDFEEEDPDFRGILEALIFASDEPLAFKQIKELLAPGESEGEENGEEETSPARPRRRNVRRLTITRVKRAIDALNDSYGEQGRSFRIIEVSGGFAFQTTAEYGAWVGRLFAERSRRRLTQSALETLAIIAFRQPISKPAVEGIRGVNAEYVVKSLLERNLISIVGREDSPGRPLLYGTTKTFLKHFGLSSINDLPKPREIKDLLSSEEELAINPIEEMDPDKAMALTGVSSQELERLFDNARLRGTGRPEAGAEQSEDATAAEAETESETETVAEAATEAEGGTEGEGETEGETEGEGDALDAPVLHVQFDAVEDEDEDDDGEDDDRTEDTPFDDEPPDEKESS